MMKRLNLLLVIVVEMIGYCYGRFDYCVDLYKEGGVLAIVQSSECSFEYLHLRDFNYSSKCQFSTLQGRRKYQEDRVLCDLDFGFNLVGNCAQENPKIGVAAIFDGHGGKEASELAVQLFPLYLQLHISFLSKQEIQLSEDKHNLAYPLETEVDAFGPHFGRQMNESRTLEVLKETIILTIRDIDSTFSQVALTKNLLAGTTATIALIVGDQLLIANVGDSKVFLCSEKDKFSSKPNGTPTLKSLQPIELTDDHHPDRDDERSRIKAAGGFVSFSGVPRVNGVLAVSRAIGDVFLKRYGVIAEPEVTGWRHLNDSDAFLVVASDGIFESLSLNDVCSLIQNAQTQSDQDDIDRYQRLSKCLSQSLAECIVNIAYEKGSSDNLSAIVVPLNTH